MVIKEKLYVSLTSWYKRINNVSKVVESLLNQTIKPDKIIVNLCTYDFPYMEENLPQDLLDLVNNNSNVEIYWFIENYKAFKKHLRVLEIAEDDALIMSADDDHLYPKNFIETMYMSYCYYGKKHPVTANKLILCHNIWTFNGPGTLYKRSDWPKDYKKYLSENILKNTLDDIVVTVLFALNNVLVMPAMFYLPPDKDLLFNDNDCWTDRGNADAFDRDNPYLSLWVGTKYILAESIQKVHFKRESSRFVPNFWDIIVDTVKRLEPSLNKNLDGVKFMLDSFYNHWLEGMVHTDETLQNALSIKRISDKSHFIGNNKLVVTVASWTMRIQNVVPVVKSILYNSILPDDIVINLAKPDFNVTDEELADPILLRLNHPDLIDLLKLITTTTNVNIYIHWYDDSELKSWKKHIYCINNYSPDDVIICIDDDKLYSEMFIETFLKSYKYFGCEFPITNCIANYCQGVLPFHGAAMLYRPKDFGDFNKFMNDKMCHLVPEDNHLLNILTANNVMLMPVIGHNYLFKDDNFNQGVSNFGNDNFDDNWWDNYRKVIDESEKILEVACEGDPALNSSWNYNMYKLAYRNVKNYLEKYKDIHTEGYAKEVYDDIENYFKNDFGNNSNTKFCKKFADIIL